jgi:heme oxygenase
LLQNLAHVRPLREGIVFCNHSHHLDVGRADHWQSFTDQLIQFKDDEFEVATATTVDEAKKVLEACFDYVTEKRGVMLFRKPKGF